ncbi:MAG: 50S ribosomal protein L29 [Elusimicrobia bacterium CG1_02_37_114]|nr:MAG: 50S ribosomal protein L29 [Elusimicrobia bacterium CG1_02_37_114]PIV52559.1 MAG: 50S ribosomal protein L29 [Elusimicrobia bacterium CG02_land_8_20_14_3_00_37_13]PIZ13288.1 MAG: 50S ribosomal protein L29 [Elusimicrobia bacterium CG_4_10_14_0_8_um_filter_37_32]
MKTKNWQEMKNFTEQELAMQLETKEEKLFKIKLQHEHATLKNPLEIRSLRRDIARIKTLLNKKI